MENHFGQVISCCEAKSLWSGCGLIIKVDIDDQKAVIKHTQVPKHIEHRHIQQSEIAKVRKAKSYQVEVEFYRSFSHNLPAYVKVPDVIWSYSSTDKNTLVFLDFTYSNFKGYESPTLDEVRQIIDWLAGFHAHFLKADINSEPNKDLLWQHGGYWHLATRPDEYNKMVSGDMKRAASVIDRALFEQRYKTLIHGDAKLANFASDGKRALGYDFQYVGQGIGIQDLMLLFTSVFDSEQLHRDSPLLLNHYFTSLKSRLTNRFSDIECDEIERQWRQAWPFVWADFYRFLLGWKPDHFKINGYMKAQAEKVISELANRHKPSL